MAESRAEERGAVFTRREVVDFILDLTGYLPERDLTQRRILEPAVGAGEFIIASAERLLDSFERQGGKPTAALAQLADAIVGVELHRPSYEQARNRLLELFSDRGFAPDTAKSLADFWLVQDDFLLTQLHGTFTDVVGNPPYLRQEAIPDVLLREYKNRYYTIYDRADLYVPFIERSLKLLGEGGRLVFICSDRWMKNKYGGPLRKLVASHFHLSAYEDMVGTPAFEGEVVAYPAIFRISRENSRETFTTRKPLLEPSSLRRLATAMTVPASNGRQRHEHVKTTSGIVDGSEPWLLDSATEVAVLRRLESTFPTIEEAGCAVGIGVATGADRVFIRPIEEFDVEDSRLLPIVKTDDIRSGEVEWQGRAVLNPYDAEGNLVPLEDFPKLSAYLHKHVQAVKGRHTAKQNPSRWYKTIDRIYPQLTSTPKLLIPDIKGAANVVFDVGMFYPHHNLYHVTSEKWDLRALQAVLRSAVAEFIVAMYAVKMRGGYLRYQAQYLRRIRLPEWTSVPAEMRDRLRAAAISPDRPARDEAAFDLYELTRSEREVVMESVYEAERAAR